MSARPFPHSHSIIHLNNFIPHSRRYSQSLTTICRGKTHWSLSVSQFKKNVLQVFSLVEILGKMEGQETREVAGRSGKVLVLSCVWPAASSASPDPKGMQGWGPTASCTVASNLVCVRALGLEPRYRGWSVGFSVCLFCVYLHLTSFHKGFKVGNCLMTITSGTFSLRQVWNSSQKRSCHWIQLKSWYFLLS